MRTTRWRRFGPARFALRIWPRALGSLRRRFFIVLALLAGLALGPWLGSIRVHNDLDGTALQLEEAGSLRYRLLDLALLLDASDGLDADELRTALSRYQRALERLIQGEKPVLPACDDGLACERLRKHLQRFRGDLAPAVFRASLRPVERDEVTLALRKELSELDETVRRLAHVGQTRVDRLVETGRIATAATLLLIVLILYGVWEVFSRIRRLEAAARTLEPMDTLTPGADEVAQLARTMSSKMSEIRRHGDQERDRAERLLEQRKAARDFADDLRDWLAEPEELDGALGRVGRTLRLDIVWADEQSHDEARLLGTAGFDERTWREAVLPIGRAMSESEILLANSGQALDLSARIPKALSELGIRSLVFVPLTLGDERLGWLGMGSHREPPVGEALSLGHLLAHSLTVALVARRLVREREHHAQFAQLLATLPELGEGAAAIGSELRRVVSHDLAILCRNGGTGVRDQTWRLEASRAVLLEEACHISAHVDLTRRTRVLKALPGQQDGEWLVAALRAGSRIVGGLALGRRVAYSPREIDAVERAAPVLASALERMRLQEQLRRAEQDTALAGMGRMVAHEVRNPLNNLMLHTHCIERIVDRFPASEDRKALVGHATVLRDELSRLSGMAGGFLGLGQPPTREEADLRDLVHEACRVYAPALEEQKVTVEVDLGDAPASTAVDRSRIREVLENLLKNAVEAVTGRAERRVRISLRRLNGAWAIHVRDSGPGVDSPDRLFAPGYTTKPLGAGMGLAICRRIAQVHGGDIVARNADGGGAEFVLTLGAGGVGVSASEGSRPA